MVYSGTERRGCALLRWEVLGATNVTRDARVRPMGHNVPCEQCRGGGARFTESTRARAYVGVKCVCYSYALSGTSTEGKTEEAMCEANATRHRR